ncbi:lipocalin family protein [Undibacterium curvum]|uniref:Outer membrane lipoprotein Blc n=1 Tax=Undibacterium curvum TaxID=2762294 RepID=A0ABR7A7V0_9BURK|nr:lipocalin family protein [Undibacterium curvum]MBC3932955.1 lipocalin family protein [Undibacterium curvum]
MSLRRFALLCTSALLTASLFSACNTQPAAPMDVVAQVDLQRYLGRWYEIALIPNRFQAMCASDTQAEYQLEGEQILVTNRCKRADQGMETAQGVAEVVAQSNNAKLRVSFFRPFYGNYWILALDPDYQWVLVGEPGRQYGWVLSRTPQLSDALMQSIWQKAEQAGYQRAQFRPSLQTQTMSSK